MLSRLLCACCCVLVLFAAPAFAALDPAIVAQLGADDSDARVAAVRKLVASEDPRAVDILKALDGDALALPSLALGSG